MNMFETAAPVAAPKKKSAKPEAARVKLRGMLAFASVDTVIKTLTGLKSVMEAQVKGRMVEHFIAEGMKTGSRPANFVGEEANARGSCELKIRGGNSPLKDEEVEKLKAAKLPFETVDAVTECFVINPAYKDDQELLAKVSKALSGVEGLPADFIQKQSQKKHLANAETLEALFALKDKAQIAELLPLCGIVSLKPSLDGEEANDKAFDLVAALLPQKAADAVAKAAK